MHPPRTTPVDPWDAAALWRWYQTRMTRNGPAVAASLRIQSVRGPDGELSQDQRLLAAIDGGAEADCSSGDVPRWPWEAIRQDLYDAITADAAWCRQHAPHLPRANPKRPVSINDAVVPF